MATSDGRNLRRVPVVLLGPGNVGRALLRQIVDARGMHAARGGLRLAIRAVVDSGGAVETADRAGFDDAAIATLVERKGRGEGLRAGVPVDGVDHAPGREGGADLAAVLERVAEPTAIVVDCSASDSVSRTLARHARGSGRLVLANKLSLVGQIEIFDAIAAAGGQGRARWEATVGAGVPIVAALRRMLDSGDEVARIEGTLSGTLNFLVTELRAGRPFSEIAAEARALRFTEPDPRVDLGGVDMARKALILARMLGWRLGMADVSVGRLYPADMDDLEPEEFMAALKGLDQGFTDRIADAARTGDVFRYAAVIEAGSCTVGPLLVPADSPMGRLTGTDNLVAFHTRWYGSGSPLVLQGRGAGAEATAAGVLADIVEVAAPLGAART